MKKVAALLALALASIALVACGSSNSGSSETSGEESAATETQGGGGSTVAFETDPSGELAYTTKSATAKAGQVTVEFNNPQSLTHDVAIEGANGEVVGKTELIASGSDSTTVNLKPGTYHFFCTVPGHREAGMEGTLTVK
jgi:plastocyanin